MHLRAILATSFIPVFLVGCSPANQITATSWEASPDDEWVTRVARYDTAGPGNNSLFEVVEMKRRSAEKVIDLITVDEGDVSSDELKGSSVITLHCRDRTHLEIYYRAGEINYQLQKVADVNVETRKLPVHR